MECYGTPPGYPAGGTRSVELKTHLMIDRWDGFSQTAPHLPDVNLADAIARTIQQPDFVLAQRQDVELAVASEEGQQRTDVEVVCDNHQFCKIQWETIATNSVGREKNRQTIALMLPEIRFLQQLAGRLEQFLYIAPAYALIR